MLCNSTFIVKCKNHSTSLVATEVRAFTLPEARTKDSVEMIVANTNVLFLFDLFFFPTLLSNRIVLVNLRSSSFDDAAICKNCSVLEFRSHPCFFATIIVLVLTYSSKIFTFKDARLLSVFRVKSGLVLVSATLKAKHDVNNLVEKMR